jgi:hypothetical protein
MFPQLQLFSPSYNRTQPYSTAAPAPALQQQPLLLLLLRRGCHKAAALN